ncbi:MAG: hypothetical protein U1D67_02000 [Dehalococcoidia bacterium]|nr:hypothetical protein [Dehalococcoidia bacterium]
MAKIVIKLFRDPRQASEVLGVLKKQGFKDDEIGLIARSNGNQVFSKASQTINFSEAGEIVAQGPVQSPLKEAGSAAEKPGLAAALSKILELPEETGSYLEFGITVGGILVSVHAEDTKAQKARDVFRSSNFTAKPKVVNSSPGFSIAERMAATDPIDAPMSGDFRKY